tara:strand:+ start:1049 stop:1258 length:210 start_codon:yes stop_codon:yes gene_type:complete
MKNKCYITAKDYFEATALQSEILEVLKESRKTILKSNVKMPDYWQDSVGQAYQMELISKIETLIQNLEQ